METPVRKRIAEAVYKSSDPNKVPEEIVKFYEELRDVYYGMTSCHDFNPRERGLVVALAIHIARLESRLAKLESEKAAAASNDSPPGEVKIDLRTREGRMLKQSGQLVGA